MYSVHEHYTMCTLNALLRDHRCYIGKLSHSSLFTVLLTIKKIVKFLKLLNPKINTDVYRNMIHNTDFHPIEYTKYRHIDHVCYYIL